MPDDLTIFTSFDGTPLGEATHYFAFVEADAQIPLASRVNDRDRLSRVPARESLTPDARRIPFVVTKTAAAAAVTPAAWYAAVQRIFSVYGGRRVLRAMLEGVEYELRCDVVQLQPRNPFTAVTGILHATDPIWRATAVSVAAGTSGITIVASAVSAASGSGVCDRPAGTGLGHVMLALVYDSGTAPTAPSGWVQWGLRTTYSAGAVTLWRRVAEASEPASYAWSGGGTIGITTYAGVDTANPGIAVALQAVVGTTTPSTPIVNITDGNVGLYAAAVAAVVTTYTPPAGMAEQFDFDGLTAATQVLAGAGPGNTSKQFTAAVSSNFVTVLAVLRPAPGAAVVGGNHPAQPTVTIATTGTPDIKRRRVTVTDNTGRGLVAFPLRIGGAATEGGAFDTSAFGALTPQDMLVISGGLPVPFFVQGIGTATTKVDTSVSVPPFGTVDIDIYYGPGVVNAVTAQAWDTRGFDLAHASHGNGQWVWRTLAGTLDGVPVRSMFDAGKAPDITGSWKLGQFGQHGAGVRFHWVQSGASIQIINDTNGPNDADGVQLVTQVEAAATDALAGLRFRETGVSEALANRATLLPGESTFITLTAITINGPHDIDGAVVIRFYAQFPEFTGFVVALDVVAGPPRLTLDATKIPTVTIGADVAARRLDGTITNSLTGDVITLSDLYMDDADDLVIDTLNQVFGPAGAVMVTGTPTGGVHFTNAIGWWILRDGADNPWVTDLAGVTITVGWRNAVQA